MIKTWQQRCEEHPDHEGIVTEQMIRDRMQEEIDELRQALAQPVDAVNMSQERVDERVKNEQDPVAWISKGGLLELLESGRTEVFRVQDYETTGTTPLYIAPPKKEWVGLAKEDMPDGDNPMFDTNEFAAGMAWAQTKLKEKNA